MRQTEEGEARLDMDIAEEAFGTGTGEIGVGGLLDTCTHDGAQILYYGHSINRFAFLMIMHDISSLI